MTHDNSSEPLPPPAAELLDLLRRIADHDDALDTVQAGARDYLQGPGGARAAPVAVASAYR